MAKNYFCRAMLCISSVYAVIRCPSVCLSFTFVDHVKTNKHIFEIFSPSGSYTILVFHTKRGGDIPTGTPNGTSNPQRQKSRFLSNSWLSKIAGRAECQKHLPTDDEVEYYSTSSSVGKCFWHSALPAIFDSQLLDCAIYTARSSVTVFVTS